MSLKSFSFASLTAVWLVSFFSCTSTPTGNTLPNPVDTTQKFTYYSFNATPTLNFKVQISDADSLTSLKIQYKVRYMYRESYTMLSGKDTTVFFDKYLYGGAYKFNSYNNPVSGVFPSTTASISCNHVDKGTSVKISVEDILVTGYRNTTLFKQGTHATKSFTFNEGDNLNPILDFTGNTISLW